MRFILTGALLLYSAITDIRDKEISGVAVLIFGVGGIVLAALSKSRSLFQLIMGLGVGLFMVAVSLLTKGELGLGDGLLLSATGLLLGFEKNLSLLLLALFLSSLYSAALFAMGRGLKKEYPFVPFLLVSYILILMFDGRLV